MDVIKLLGFAIICIVVLTVIKQTKSEFSLAVRLCISVAFLGIILSLCVPIYNYIKSISDAGEFSEYFDVILKGLGIALVIRISSDVCRDIGETSVCTYIETIGRLELTILTIPLIEKLMNVVKDLL